MESNILKVILGIIIVVVIVTCIKGLIKVAFRMILTGIVVTGIYVVVVMLIPTKVRTGSFVLPSNVIEQLKQSKKVDVRALGTLDQIYIKIESEWVQLKDISVIGETRNELKLRINQKVVSVRDREVMNILKTVYKEK